MAVRPDRRNPLARKLVKAIQAVKRNVSGPVKKTAKKAYADALSHPAAPLAMKMMHDYAQVTQHMTGQSPVSLADPGGTLLDAPALGKKIVDNLPKGHPMRNAFAAKFRGIRKLPMGSRLSRAVKNFMKSESHDPSSQ